MKREDLELLASIRKITGVQIKLGEHDEIKSHKTAENSIMLAVTVLDVTDTARETRFKRQGWKIYTIEKVGDGSSWRLTDTTDIVWNDAFVPYTFEKFSRYETQQQLNERAEWESICHRPGTARTPMDNADRRFQKKTFGL